MDKRSRCYIYMRVSTEMQVDGYSLEAQKNSLVKYAGFQKMDIAGEYCDAGRSGKSISGRPEFMRMLQDVADQKDPVEYILVFKLSRFGRNAADVLNSLQYIQDYGVNLISVEDGIDSSKDSGKLTITVLSAVAEIERENILVQTMEGRKQKAREGKWNGGQAPLGYSIDTKKGILVVNPEEAEIVKVIFDRYAHTNDGFDAIAIYLNQHGYQKEKRKTHNLNYFTHSYISRILSNPVYIGKIKYGENVFEKVKGTRDDFRRVKTDDYILVDGQHEAIIDDELWNAVQERRAEAAKINHRKFNPDHEHILSGIIKCPLCGRGLVGAVRKRHNKNGTTVENYFYRCGHGKIAEDGSRCTYRPSWNEEKFDGMIERTLLDMVENPSFKEYMIKRLQKKVDVSSLEADRDRLREQLRQASGAKAKLLSMIEKLDVMDRHYDRKSRDMQDRLDMIYDKISDIEDSISAITQKINRAYREHLDTEQMYAVLSNYDTIYRRMTDHEKKIFFSQFVESIVLDPDETDMEKAVKEINLMFPVEINGELTDRIRFPEKTIVETIVLMTRSQS